MSWIFSLAVISLTEGISYGQDQCPEENRNRFLKSKQHFYKKRNLKTVFNNFCKKNRKKFTMETKFGYVY